MSARRDGRSLRLVGEDGHPQRSRGTQRQPSVMKYRSGLRQQRNRADWNSVEGRKVGRGPPIGQRKRRLSDRERERERERVVKFVGLRVDEDRNGLPSRARVRRVG